MTKVNKYNDYMILTGVKDKFIMIPSEIIYKCDLNSKRVAVYSYLYIKTGLDYNLILSLRAISNWIGKKMDSHKNRNTSTTKILSIIEDFKNKGLLLYSNNLTYTSYINATFKKDSIIDYCQNKDRFAKIYIDEINDIMQYKNKSQDARFDNSVVLLVFAYLRLNIPINNDLKGAKTRPEAFDQCYDKIGLELGISGNAVSNAVEILQKLNLIYAKDRGRTPNNKQKTHIFCNTYKRMTNNGVTYLTASGKSYYFHEANKKEDILNKMGR